MDTIHFLHIGKTGGTAFKSAIKESADSWIPSRRHTKYGRKALDLIGTAIMPGGLRIILHSHRKGLAGVMSGKAVFCLRDPISRFVSGFYSRKRMGLPRTYHSWSRQEQAAFSRFPTADDLASALGSCNASTKSKAERAMHSVGHIKEPFTNWLKNPEYLTERKDDILFIGFQENLDHDFELFKKTIGLPSDCSLPKDPTRSHKNPESSPKALSDEAVRNLEEWYKKDFELLELCKQIRSSI